MNKSIEIVEAKKVIDVVEIVESHECDVLKKYNDSSPKRGIAIQRFGNLRWYWVKFGDEGDMADGIGYCPYCGQKL